MNPTLKAIENVVCRYYDVTPEQLRLKTRKREIVVPRQIIYYLSYHFTNLGMAATAAEYGQHHATLNYACHQVDNLRFTCKEYAYNLLCIERDIPELRAEPKEDDRNHYMQIRQAESFELETFCNNSIQL